MQPCACDAIVNTVAAANLLSSNILGDKSPILGNAQFVWEEGEDKKLWRLGERTQDICSITIEFTLGFMVLFC